MIEINKCASREALKFHARAFSLIELLVMLTILGILTGFAVQGYTQWAKDARLAKARTDVSTLADLVSKFEIEQNADVTPCGINATARIQGVDIVATFEGQATKSASMNITVMADKMKKSPRYVYVSISKDDTPDKVAAKAAAELSKDGGITSFFGVRPNGNDVQLSASEAGPMRIIVTTALRLRSLQELKGKYISDVEMLRDPWGFEYRVLPEYGVIESMDLVPGNEASAEQKYKVFKADVPTWNPKTGEHPKIVYSMGPNTMDDRGRGDDIKKECRPFKYLERVVTQRTR